MRRRSIHETHHCLFKGPAQKRNERLLKALFGFNPVGPGDQDAIAFILQGDLGVHLFAHKLLHFVHLCHLVRLPFWRLVRRYALFNRSAVAQVDFAEAPGFDRIRAEKGHFANSRHEGRKSFEVLREESRILSQIVEDIPHGSFEVSLNGKNAIHADRLGQGGFLHSLFKNDVKKSRSKRCNVMFSYLRLWLLAIFSLAACRPSTPQDYTPFLLLASLPTTRTGLYVMNNGNNTVSAFMFDPQTETLTSTGSQATQTAPRWGALSPNGKFLFVPNSSSNSVSVYAIQTTGSVSAIGRLTPLGTTPAGTGPQMALPDRTGAYLYAPNSTSNNVSSYTFDGAGSLASTGTATVGGTQYVAAAVLPGNQYLFVIVRGSTQISRFTIGSGGALSAGATPITGLTNPSSIAAEPTGRFVYVGDTTNVIPYTVNSAGGLTAGTSVSGGAVAPLWLTADPTGKYLVSVSQAATTAQVGLTLFGINQTTGALTALYSTTVFNNPIGAVFDATGKYMLTVDIANLSIMRIDPTTGTASVIAAQAAANSPVALASGGVPFY